MAFRNFEYGEAGLRQQRTRLMANPLAVLERAGRVIGDAEARPGERREQPKLIDELADVAGDARHVGGALGVGELIHEVPTRFPCEPRGLDVDLRRILDEMTTPAVKLDGGDLLGRGCRRHDRDERQAEQAREIRFRNGSRATRGFDDSAAFAQPAVRERIQEERARESMLETAGRMARLILEIEIDARKARQIERNEMRVGRAIEVGLDLVNGVGRPVAMGHGEVCVQRRHAG